MCTAISYAPGAHYFGRTLDLECSFGERVTVIPRAAALTFKRLPTLPRHHAMVGMTADALWPLFYDGMNEKGLCIAALNFPGNARYCPPAEEEQNPAPYELIPWVLAQCGTVAEVRQLLEGSRLLAIHYSAEMPLTPLHWLVADGRQAMVVESVAEGLRLYNDPPGVLTNNPPFPLQLFHLNDYRHLSPAPSENRFSSTLPLDLYSRGMGGIGLPGDWSSGSRFVRAAFATANAVAGEGEQAGLRQAFHILDTVKIPRGVVRLKDGATVVTTYTAVCDAENGVYYVRTYDSPQPVGIALAGTDLEGTQPVTYPLPGAGRYPIVNEK